MDQLPEKLPEEGQVSETGEVGERGMVGEEEIKTEEKKRDWRQWLRELLADEKRSIRVMGGLILGLLMVTAVVISIKERLAVEETEKKAEELGKKLLSDEKAPGQMVFIFYKDSDSDGVYDYEEEAFRDISVAIRRPGEELAWRTVPSDKDGRVRIDGLSGGEYEIQYVNYELDPGETEGDFYFPRYYELVEEGKSRFSFLPTEWMKVVLKAEGNQTVVGIRDYQPKRVLVGQNGGKVSFYEPERARIFGYSQVFEEGGENQFDLKGENLFYVKDNQLRKFSFRDRVASVVMSYLQGLEGKAWRLSPEGRTIVFKEGEELRYRTVEGWCGEGGLLDQGRRLQVEGREVADGSQRILADFGDEERLVFVGGPKGGERRVYITECGEKDKLEVKVLPIAAERIDSLYFLDKDDLLISGRFRVGKNCDEAGENCDWSSFNGHHFYNIGENVARQYVAMGVGGVAAVSGDKKQVVSLAGENYVMVDYAAVKASGVEKHYTIPIKEILTHGLIKPVTEVWAWGKDVAWFNDAKICEADGDCGEVDRVWLKGNGVWEDEVYAQLKDWQPERLLGEIELN